MANAFSYPSYDLLTGAPLGEVPLRGVTFGSTLNSPGQLQGSIDLSDPKVRAMDPYTTTAPNRTFVGVDFQGQLVNGYNSMTRKWPVQGSGSESQQGPWAYQGSELWSWMQQRNQATDYSAPPSSGITDSMVLWTQTPWDATLITAQIILDALSYQNGQPSAFADVLGGLDVLINGATPSASSPPAGAEDWIALNFPFTGVESIDSVVQQLVQLGLGVSPDIGVDFAYSGGPGSSPVGTINLSYPRRGRVQANSQLMIDLSTARKYEFDEDGTQTANTVIEVGGSSAIVVAQNSNPLAQGYPLWERVLSRSGAQSQDILTLLGQQAVSDLAVLSYAPVAPVVTLSVFDKNMPLGSFLVGDDARLCMPGKSRDGEVFDPRFPHGLDQEWRIVGYQVNAVDEGDPTMDITLNLPPFLEAISPAL